MNILKRSIFIEIVGSFLLGSLVFSTILVTNEITRKLIETLVQETLTFKEVGVIFLCILPKILVFSIPMATLLGILVCFSRLSADNEITAMRSSGISIQNLLSPVLIFAILVSLFALLNTSYLSPKASSYLAGMIDQIAIKSLNTAIRIGVFEERFPNRVLYIRDSSPDKRNWTGIFLADLSDAENPIITFSKKGHLFNNLNNQNLLLNLTQGASYEANPREAGAVRVISFDRTTIPLYSAKRTTPARETKENISELDSLELYSKLYPKEFKKGLNSVDYRQATIEFNRRLALSFAVLIFAILGLPLGVVTRQGGKSLGFIISLGIFLGYFILFSQGLRLAEGGKIPAFLGPWLANIVSLICGLLLLLSADKRIFWGIFNRTSHLPRFKNPFKFLSSEQLKFSSENFSRKEQKLRYSIPTILDLYVIKGFFSLFFLVIASFIVIFIVFTFFELLSDILEHSIDPLIVFNYFLFLVPHMLLVMVPFSVLVAILVQFSLLTRTSQIDAMKSCGVSLYRVATTIFLMTLLVSISSFGIQEYVSPLANQKQDDLRRMIKGRSPQTKRPIKQWMMGEKERIFHYNFFDDEKNVFNKISVFDFEKETFSLKQMIFAENAYWDEMSSRWIFEKGWTQGFTHGRPGRNQFVAIKSEPMKTINEDPAYFKKEVKPSSQMSYMDLRNHVKDLKQSGFDVVQLSVALHRKLSFPLVALTMSMIAIPFALSTGRRGSLYGIGLSVVIGISYWVLQGFFEQLGSAGRLEPFLAAWAPNLIFGGCGIYLLFNIRT